MLWRAAFEQPGQFHQVWISCFQVFFGEKLGWWQVRHLLRPMMGWSTFTSSLHCFANHRRAERNGHLKLCSLLSCGILKQKFIFKFRVLTLGSISTLWDPSCTWLPHPKINKHFLQHYYTQKRNMQRVFPICQFHGFVVYCPKGPVCITVVYKGVCEKSPESSHYMPLHFTAM